MESDDDGGLDKDAAGVEGSCASGVAVGEGQLDPRHLSSALAVPALVRVEQTLRTKHSQVIRVGLARPSWPCPPNTEFPICTVLQI